MARLAEGSRRDRYHALWVTLLYTGMRIGEALALTWRDFDADARTLAVNRSLESVAGGEPTLSDPKTYASKRTLRVPPAVVALLRQHKLTQNLERLAAGPAYRQHDLVFATRLGTPLVRRDIYDSFQRLLRRKNVGLRGTLHTCRHTVATNLLYAGVPLTEVSYILGHASVAVTAKTYAHVLPRGATEGWTPPPGLRGLDLLEAWYARGSEARDNAPQDEVAQLSR